MTSVSLRLRLTLIILLPLMLIAAFVAVWQVRAARDTAVDVFDRSLLSTGLAIAADVARSRGDAIKPSTRDQLGNTSGGPVFYHVYAPDGIYVTGYATPPVPLTERPDPEAEIAFFDAVYYGRDVRVVRLRNPTTIDSISGIFTFTIWQDVAVRAAFVRDLSLRAFIVIAILTGSVGLVVWFGVNTGLKPLLDLEEAISRRSSDDLQPIRRPVPVETRGLVRRINALLGQVSNTMKAQNDFISNAAHQLRNPIAGVLALAEAAESAPTPEEAQSRSADLLAAARHVSDLANKLLTLERVRSAEAMTMPVDLNEIAAEVARLHAEPARARSVTLDLHLGDDPAVVLADPVMLREAVANLADNALRHGGDALTRVGIAVTRQDDAIILEVSDDGAGVAPDALPTILSRFGQANPGEGSGLGLSIAEAVAERHGGTLIVAPCDSGLSVRFRLPAAVS